MTQRAYLVDKTEYGMRLLEPELPDASVDIKTVSS